MEWLEVETLDVEWLELVTLTVALLDVEWLELVTLKSSRKRKDPLSMQSLEAVD